MFYSAFKNTFFAPEFRADYEAAGTWPDDALEVPFSVFVQCVNERPADKIMVPGEDGMPTLIDKPALSLEELKAEKNAEINAARLRANSSTFEHGGKLFSCDPLSRSDIDGTANHIALFGAFPPDFPGAWKAVDNSILPLPTVDEFKSLYQSMTAAGAANFNKSQLLKAQLAAASTAEQVAAIAW